MSVLAVEFQDYWAGLTSKSLGGSSGSSGRTSNPGLFALEGSTTSDSRYQVGGWIEFQEDWAGLTLKSLGGRREAASFICCERNAPSIAKSRRISLDQVLAVEFLNFASFEPVLHSSRSVWKLGSVQSSHISSGITTRNQLILALVFYFKTFEPVQHWSRSVESVEEASNLGMFPVEVVLLVAYQWLNWSTHS